MGMKMEYVLILVIILTVCIAGCTGPGATEKQAQIGHTITVASTIPPVRVGTTVKTAVATPIKETTAGMVPAKVFLGDYHWVEYRNSISVTMPPNPRYTWEERVRAERSMNTYRGIPSVRFKITTIQDYGECCIDNVVDTTKDGLITVDDRYYDLSSDRFLGGTETKTIKGELKPAIEVPGSQYTREDRPGGYLGIEPFGEMNVSLTSPGTETVTVPAGIWPDARKYTGNFRDGTPITFWVAPGTPVPVKYEFPDKYMDGEDGFQSFELKGWG
jgi:hypothetical protein